ncbi:MAG: ISAzo13 family transposase [Terriglobia bacterium]
MRASTPALIESFETVIDTRTAGDPMQEGVLWTNLTRSEIAMGLAEEGFEVSTTVVDRLLDHFDFRQRKAQKVKTMGESQDRDAQFQKIDRLKKEYLEAELPVLSMDTKKRETLGDYAREGRVYSTAPLAAWDHDFPNHRRGIVIPHGLYDLGLNEGYLHLGTSHDTSEFAIDSLMHWWEEHGIHHYPGAERILVLADSGGSNSCRRVVFKAELQTFADLTGLEVRIAHYPTHCSKYNPIEHRLFPHVTRVCRGVMLQSVQMVRTLMEKASTRTGLRVFVDVLDSVYRIGLKVPNFVRDSLRIRFDGLLPLWNYVVSPDRSLEYWELI